MFSQKFKSLLDSSLSFSSPSVVRFQYLRPISNPHVFFIIKKKYGNAVARNLFKRRARNLYKNILKKNSCSLGLVVCPLKADISHLELKECFSKLEGHLYE